MKLILGTLLGLVVLGALLLAACSSDPNVRKLNYQKSGEKYFAKGQYRSAEVEFRNALAIDPRFEPAHFRLAQTYLKLAEYGPARREMETTVTLNPQNSQAQLQLTGMFLASQEYQQAQELAEKLLAADQGNGRAHEMLGAADFAKRDVSGAIQELRKAIEAAPHGLSGYVNLAKVYVSTNRLEEAEAAYRKCVEANPQSAEARTALGQFHFSTGKMALAEQDFKAAVGLGPHDVLPRLALVPVYLATKRIADAERVCRDLKTLAPDAPKAYRALGLFYTLTGEADKALAEFRALSASKPKDTRVKAFAIDILLDKGRLGEAAQLNRELLKALPGDPEGLLFSGRIGILQGHYQQAQTEIEKSLKTDTQSASGHYLLGVAQNAQGFDKQAKASWAHALELNPRLTVARVALADTAASHGDYDEALRQTGEILKTQPGLVNAHLIRARGLIGKGNTKEAEAVLQAVLDRDPTSLPALSALVNLRIQEGKPQTLVPVISKSVEQNPRNPGLHFWLAVVYFRSNDSANAEASAKQAIALDPKPWEPYGLLAQIHMARGSADAAKADLRAEIDRNPRSVKGYTALEGLYEREGNWEEAKKLAEKAHQVDPTDPLVANNLAYIYLEHGGDVNMAVSLARDARQKVPDAPAAADTLGWAYYKLGSAQAAVTQLAESVRKAPGNPEYQYHLGMAYLAAGHMDLAKQYLRRAITSDPHFPEAASAKSTLDKISLQSPPVAKK